MCVIAELSDIHLLTLVQMMRLSDTLYTFHPIFLKYIYINKYIYVITSCIYLFSCDSFRILSQTAFLRNVCQNHDPGGHPRVRMLYFLQKVGARWLAYNCNFEETQEPSNIESRNDIETT